MTPGPPRARTRLRHAARMTHSTRSSHPRRRTTPRHPVSPRGLRTLRATWERQAAEAGGPGGFHHLHGPHTHGWLLADAVPELLEPIVHADDDPLEPTFFAHLDAPVAEALLARFAPAHLVHRSNGSPTLGNQLRATVAHPGEITLHGFVLGPGRCDERLVSEGALVRFEADLLVTEHHAPGCECELLWAYAVDELGLDDAEHAPHRIHRIHRAEAPDETWWRLLWA
ncbi:hypothetical protein OJAG_01940 [Oerskovia enterophila]|uniref:Uncharacterized protein n=2 Tax=Cellulomonadaceae TaxID=85016 RepID=A0A163T4V7_9CELL|nr:hypothetical protein OJAG_01940 [Oerskovia enterophila]OCI30754.1 hypothetical protein OERS_25140 [Oerskovia enterophila]